MSRAFRTIMFSVVALAAAGVGHGDDKKPQEVAGWGTVVDPAGDCNVALQGGTLTITVPGTHHDLNPTPAFNNVLAPRVLRDVAGDFAAQVRVAAFERPKPKTSANKRHSYVGAGLLVWHDEKNFIRLLRAANGDSGLLFASVEVYRDGKVADNHLSPVQDGDTHLRLSRVGNTFTYAVSGDGKDWKELPLRLKDVDLPAKVRVGVAAVNSTVKEFAPRLEGLALTGR